jgi:release factor glutamine methyltransferase
VLALQAARIESASLDARLLLQQALGLSREQLLLDAQRPLSAQQAERFQALVARRVKREPIAQILGQREFYGREFIVTRDTLDPRPDSETLIDAALARIAGRAVPLQLLDLGTGTGCLLLTLLAELPQAQGLGVDASPQALAVAQENAQKLGLSSRARWQVGHWFKGLQGPFDVVLSNPPYIPAADIGGLSPEVAEYEPRLALDGGADGLDAYREICRQLPHFLAKEGFAVLEFGMGQERAIAALAQQAGLQVVAMRPDLNGITRCMVLQQQ